MIPCFNGSHSYSIAWAKVNHHSILKSLNLKFPESWIFQNPKDLQTGIEKLKFPSLVKPNIGGLGKGIFKLKNEEDLEKYLIQMEEGNEIQ